MPPSVEANLGLKDTMRARIYHARVWCYLMRRGLCPGRSDL